MKKEKRSERKKRKLLLALLLMLLTGGILSIGTYAWFSSNKTVTVSDIEVKVAASNGLQLSVDGVNFKSIISNEDILTKAYTGNTNHIPADPDAIVPVSTVPVKKSTDGYLTMFKGEIITDTDTGNNILTTTEITSETNNTTDFIAFDLFMQVTQDSQIYLTDASLVSSDDSNKGTAYASRVAFVYQGNAATGSDASDIIGLVNKSNANTPSGDKPVIIWEPNYDVHKASGLTNAEIYGESVFGTGITPSAAGSPRLKYYGVKSAITPTNKVALNSTSNTYFSEITTDNLIATPVAGISSSAYQPVFTLKAGITKMRVYMWMEGQDVDCENNASGAKLTYALQFSVLDKAA